MNSKKPVVVATDGSAMSFRTLPHAALLAGALDAPLCVLQVLDSGQDADAARAGCEAELKREGLDAEVRIEARQRSEKTADAILRLASELDASALALDSRGHGALRHAIHGSVALDVLKSTELPLLVTGPNVGPAAKDALPYLIVATSDGSKASETLLRELSDLALQEACKLVLLRVHEHEPGRQDDSASVEAHRADLETARGMLPSEIDVELVVREIPRGAGVDTAIIERAQEAGAHAIALSTHGHSARRHVVAGSVAMTLLGRSPLPLLLARADV